MEHEISYTIIIPHKNIPNLLQRCLDSIPQREDIQTIVVDDNSDLDKVNFETFPGLTKPYTEIIFTKESKGAGYVKNIGLKKAKGKWLLIADADDFFAENFLAYLDKYKNSDYDLVYFGIYRISKKKGDNIDPYYDNLMKNAIQYQKYDDYKYRDPNSWGKMMRLSSIMENHITFDETRVATDRMFSIKNAFYAKKIFFDEHRIYTYNIEQRPGSLTTIQTPEANFDRFYVYVRMNRFFEDISQDKYKINLLSTLLKLVDTQNMEYFNKGIKLFKENNFCFFSELFKFCWILPKKILDKLTR